MAQAPEAQERAGPVVVAGASGPAAGERAVGPAPVAAERVVRVAAASVEWARVAAERFGEDGFWIDGERRRIPDHWHAQICVDAMKAGKDAMARQVVSTAGLISFRFRHAM